MPIDAKPEKQSTRDNTPKAISERERCACWRPAKLSSGADRRRSSSMVGLVCVSCGRREPAQGGLVVQSAAA
jgi:hypothetical protein